MFAYPLSLRNRLQRSPRASSGHSSSSAKRQWCPFSSAAAARNVREVEFLMQSNILLVDDDP